jgi:Uma2 family endonuclease
MAVVERDLAAVDQVSPAPWKCSREHFQQMGELGMFVGQHVMLFEGEIVAMPAMGDRHRTSVILASDRLRDLFDGGYFVSVQCPFDIGKATDPEPDIAVIAGQIRDYATRGLTQAALIVEVSDATLDFDRRTKAPLYAGAGVADYWIINLNAAQIEVHRQPLPPDQIFGTGYTDVKTYRKGQSIELLAKPGVQVLVDDLLP